MNFSLLSAYIVAQITKGEAGLGGLPDRLTRDNILDGLAIVGGIAGGVSLIIMAFGGFKYVLSQGNPQEVQKAKNTIIDGLIGLVVVISAGGIIGFVVGILVP